MFKRLFLLIVVVVLVSCATAPTVTTIPSPIMHTPCMHGVDLSGQTVNLYQMVDAYSDDPPLQAYKAGFEDATDYFNAHGGICGATLAQVYPKGSDENISTIYADFSARKPKPVLVTFAYSEDQETLRDRLASDEIPAFQLVGGWESGLYSNDGKTPGWIFLPVNPVYPDQLGSVCNYVAAHLDTYPNPSLGFITLNGDATQMPYPQARSYCEHLGLRFAGIKSAAVGSDQTSAAIQKLIDAGANLLYTADREDGPAVIARALANMDLHDKIPLIATHLALDEGNALESEVDPNTDGLPAMNGMIGIMPSRSWAESDHPGIKLIIKQADLKGRPLTIRTNGYIWAWAITDLFVETYIRTGNRVGFDKVTGAEMKNILENLVYAPLDGVENIDFRHGRRSLSSTSIGQLHYLGKDGRTPAGTDNPPIIKTVDGTNYFIPIIEPLSDFQHVPDLRPGGVNVP